MKSITREEALQDLETKLKSFPIVGILGPRQCGKTTLAKQGKIILTKRRVIFL